MLMSLGTYAKPCEPPRERIRSFGIEETPHPFVRNKRQNDNVNAWCKRKGSAMEPEMLEVFAMEGDEKAARAKQRVRGIGGPISVDPTFHSQERVGRTQLESGAQRRWSRRQSTIDCVIMSIERETRTNWTVG